jgi:uncharacterized membrane protein YfcA
MTEADLLPMLLVCAVGLGAGVLGGVIGFGTTILLMPPLVHFYGPMTAVPVIALVALVANFSRVMLWWRDIDWKLCATYSAAAVPAVVLGANTLVQFDARLIECILGGFLLLMIPARRWLRRLDFKPARRDMAVVGYLTGIVASTGAINTPFFLAYGLVRGAYIGTEAASSLAVFLAKGITFHRLGVIDTRAILQGLSIGVFVLLGSTLSKRLVLKLPEQHFVLIMEAVMAVSGLSILWMAWPRTA